MATPKMDVDRMIKVGGLGALLGASLAVVRFTTQVRVSTARHTRATAEGVAEVREGTLAVQDAVARMDASTTRMQRIAVIVGAVTATVSALLGAVAGAVVARLL